MKRRILLAIAAAVFFLTSLTTAFALENGQARVVIGANLDETQRAQVYKDFGIEKDSVTELTVSNAEERKYLEGLVSEQKIGNVALSCVYIKALEKGAGLKIETKNINWCSTDMYKNALTTAGISDAEVHITAPYPVSGTAALTGIYRAYEDITGKSLNITAKTVAAEEIVVTGKLAEMLGNVDATVLVNELKTILAQTKGMTDDDLRAQIKATAAANNISVTDAQIEQLVGLCRSLEKLDSNALAQKVNSITQALENASKLQQTASDVASNVKTFFVSIGNFFANLFGK